MSQLPLCAILPLYLHLRRFAAQHLDPYPTFKAEVTIVDRCGEGMVETMDSLESVDSMVNVSEYTIPGSHGSVLWPFLYAYKECCFLYTYE